MLTIILEALTPVFFGLALGYLAGYTRNVNNAHVAELNSLAAAIYFTADMT